METQKQPEAEAARERPKPDATGYITYGLSCTLRRQRDRRSSPEGNNEIDPNREKKKRKEKKKQKHDSLRSTSNKITKLSCASQRVLLRQLRERVSLVQVCNTRHTHACAARPDAKSSSRCNTPPVLTTPASSTPLPTLTIPAICRTTDSYIRRTINKKWSFSFRPQHAMDKSSTSARGRHR